MGATLARMTRRKPTLLHFADTPATLGVRNSDGSKSTGSLRELVERHCPTLFSGFKPVWWLWNGHLQTIYCVLGDFSKTDVLHYSRKLLQVVEGGTMCRSGFCSCGEASAIPDDAPIIVVLHGLTGGNLAYAPTKAMCALSLYLPSNTVAIVPLLSISEDAGAGVPITSGQMYSAGYTGDIRQALIYISKLYPRAQLFGLGFSLGANVLTRYLAEEQEKSRLQAACVLACPWDLARNNHVLRYSFLGRFYSRAMGTNLINLVKRNFDSLTKHSNLIEPVTNVINLKNALLDDFDENFTRVAGGSPPEFPFPSAQAYYNWASSHEIVHKIRVPFLAINAADDPVVQHVPFDGGGNGLAVMALTASGGHLGWFHGKTERWITRPVLEWMDLVSKVLVQSPQERAMIYTHDDGFLKEEGRDGGVKLVGETLIEASAWDGVEVKGSLQGL
ncbi:AB hydrolase-1 domain-containing protein [Mycena indigotica]|uniref:AB hydrolase-1 domain-containing protein n=1 Tax=Mycena indigotica TaxID=2126181 RepID=A0A8H6S9T3_9AGAR|nr:AB hydrolase-1 domain-containing protein [Mycena indigotica]KAF7294953.1 AB hydrolase-1 domain-containing protein [Mycena indigotica]